MTSTAKPVEVKNGVYWLQSVFNNRVLDGQGSTVNGARIVGHKKNDLSVVSVSSQLWIIHKNSVDHGYAIQNANSRAYMDCKHGVDVLNGIHIVGYHQKNHNWKIKRCIHNSSVYYVIINRDTGSYLHMRDNPDNDSTPGIVHVGGWEGKGDTTKNTREMWRLVPAHA